MLSVVFGIARWRSASCSASQAGRKEAAARVSRRGQSIQTVLLSSPAAFLLEESVSSSGPLELDSPPH